MLKREDCWYCCCWNQELGALALVATVELGTLELVLLVVLLELVLLGYMLG